MMRRYLLFIFIGLISFSTLGPILNLSRFGIVQAEDHTTYIVEEFNLKNRTWIAYNFYSSSFASYRIAEWSCSGQNYEFRINSGILNTKNGATAEGYFSGVYIPSKVMVNTVSLGARFSSSATGYLKNEMRFNGKAYLIKEPKKNYLYFPTNSSSGLCSPAQLGMNNVNPYPFPITGIFEVWFNDVKDTFELISYHADGTIGESIIKQGTGVHTGIFTIPVNGKIRVKTNSCCNIMYFFDRAAPNVPQISGIDPGLDNLIDLNEKIYTNADDIVLWWEPVADNKTTVGKYQIGSDYASSYMVNINDSDTEWLSNTKKELSSAKSTAEGTYRIKIKARDNEQNESSYSKPITVVIDRSVTQPVLTTSSIQIDITSENKYNVMFNWGALTDATGIKYQVALSQSNVQPIDSEVIDDVTVNQYLFSDIEYSKNPYYAYVRSVDGLGNTSDWTKSANIVFTTVGARINSIEAKSQLSNDQPFYSVTLTFEEVDAHSYVIERQLDGESNRIVLAEITKQQLAENNYKYTDSFDLAKHENYTYYVYTKNSIGTKSQEHSSAITIANIPASIVIADATGNPLQEQIFINSTSYKFAINTDKDGEGDQLRYRIKCQSSDGSKIIYSNDADSLQMGSITVQGLTEGSWICQAEVGEFIDEVELNDNSYSRSISPILTVVVDLTSPPHIENSFVIKSVTGELVYDNVNKWTCNSNVRLGDIILNDNFGGSGIKAVCFWNGDTLIPPADAVYKLVSEVQTDIAWMLLPGDGEKTISMQVIDNAGNTTLVTRTVILGHIIPYCYNGLGEQGLGIVNQLLRFVVETGKIINFSGEFSWDFGDGSPVATGSTVFHKFTQSGTYLVKVTGIDSQGNKHTGEVTVKIDMVSSINDPSNYTVAEYIMIDQEDDTGNWTEIWRASGKNGGGIFLYHSKKNQLWWLLVGDGIHPTQHEKISDNITPYGNTYLYKVIANPANVKVEFYNMANEKVGELSIDNPKLPTVLCEN